MLRTARWKNARPAGPRRVRLAWVVFALSGLLPAGATVLPDGFQETIVVEVPFPANLSQFAFAPDGRLFLADKFGLLTAYAPVVDPAGFVLESSHQLAVDATGERGINGLAVDPDFQLNGHVWVYHTVPDPARNRLSRFTYLGGALSNESIVLELPPVQSAVNNAGCLRFAPNGTLFVSTGDDNQGSFSAFDLRGKILRLNRDGSPAAGNPYLDGAAGDPRVWARGFRNPYRISVQPESGNLFIADVGGAAWEELSLGIAGADFGWSDVEGPAPAAVPGKVYPIHAVPHPPGQGAAIIGGDHAPSDFAPDYQGDYFYADFVQRTLWRLALDVTNTPTGVELFATDFGPATDLQFGPGGGLYYICRSCAPASLRRIAYDPGVNAAPVARASGLPDSGASPLQVTLSGLGSSDADDDPLTYHWDLGDGAESDLPEPTHAYAAGVHHATLTVSDGQGGVDSAPPLRVVAGNSRPQAVVNTPQDESLYNAGQIVPYSGLVTDAEEGQISCAAATWQVFRHHGTHSHPVRGPVQGNCVGVFAIPTSGESDADQWYEIRLTGRDSGAPLGAGAELSGSASIEIRPNLSAMTFESTPIAGLTLQLDGVGLQTPATVLGLVNASRTIGSADPQLGPDGLWYRFEGWSDGGARVHTVTTPSEDVTYTADFSCAAPEITNLMINPGTAGRIELTWDEPEGDCLQAGSGRYRIYAATVPEPDAAPGDFPNDPPYRLLATSGTPQLSLAASPRDVYFLVVGAGPDDRDGVTGHYGF